VVPVELGKFRQRAMSAPPFIQSNLIVKIGVDSDVRPFKIQGEPFTGLLGLGIGLGIRTAIVSAVLPIFTAAIPIAATFAAASPTTESTTTFFASVSPPVVVIVIATGS
jgi:hypothetical protein